MYAVMQASMGRGMGDPQDVKELLFSAAAAWGDSAQQSYLRGMLDVLKQQNRARRQVGSIPGDGLGGGGTPGDGVGGGGGGATPSTGARPPQAGGGGAAAGFTTPLPR